MKNGAPAGVALSQSSAALRKIVLPTPARSNAGAAAGAGAAAAAVTCPSRLLQTTGTRGQLSLLPRPCLPR